MFRNEDEDQAQLDASNALLALQTYKVTGEPEYWKHFLFHYDRALYFMPTQGTA